MKRRSFIKHVTTGLAAAAMLRKNILAQDSNPAAGAPQVIGTKGATVIASDRTTVVETAAGKVRGFQRKGIYVFKGMPYGAPTNGDARFMPPAKPKAWPGIQNALRYGPICPSYDGLMISKDDDRSPVDEDAFLLHRGMGSVRIPGEDCLRANVWTQEINGSHRRPVMVYMHGGGYESGSGHDLLSYDGENLARDYDVVVVTHNHRLNAFGYLNLAEIGGDKYASSANVGLLDLVALLEWVRDNIASFGGDAGNVTIFGQSGGGGKVIDLMAMPAAKGLFHRGVVQSGPILKALMPDYSTKMAWELLRVLGLGKSQLDELHAVDSERLALAAEKAHTNLSPRSSTKLNRRFELGGWGPTVDGLILPRHPFDPDGPSVSADVPLITGTNLHEAVNGVDRPDAQFMTEAELNSKVQDGCGDQGKDIIAAYRRSYPGASPFDLYASIAAGQFRILAGEQGLRKAAQGAAPAYLYMFSWRTPTLDNRPGSFHACEISFAFNNAVLCDQYSCLLPEAIELSKQMSAAWVSFARTGNPNHSGIPHWPAYVADSKSTMIFDTPCEVRQDPEGEGLRLIASS